MVEDKKDHRMNPTSVAFSSNIDRDITYREAVQIAKAALADVPDLSGAAILYTEKIAEHTGLMLLSKYPKALVQDATESSESFQQLLFGIALMLNNGEGLPPEATRWLVQYLRGEIYRPLDKAGAKSKMAVHLKIAWTVGGLVKRGLKATRNDASPAVSACDAVAEAMLELELKPATFFAIKRIWLSLPKRVRAIYCD